MNDWFEWKGVRCTTLGIHVSEQPAITIPEERVTFTDVPGLSGSLTQLEGEYVYNDITLTVECFIENTASIGNIIAFLTGSGTVKFAARPDGYYKARIVNQIPFEKILRGSPFRTFAVNFRCKPFFYLNPGADIVVVRSGDFVTNPGCVPSEPVITIEGSGDIELFVGLQDVIDLQDVDGSITVDTQQLECYKGTDLCNEKMDGEFPLLYPGQNAISWEGTVTKVTVQPNWRTL